MLPSHSWQRIFKAEDGSSILKQKSRVHLLRNAIFSGCLPAKRANVTTGVVKLKGPDSKQQMTEMAKVGVVTVTTFWMGLLMFGNRDRKVDVFMEIIFCVQQKGELWGMICDGGGGFLWPDKKDVKISPLVAVNLGRSLLYFLSVIICAYVKLIWFEIHCENKAADAILNNEGFVDLT